MKNGGLCAKQSQHDFNTFIGVSFLCAHLFFSLFTQYFELYLNKPMPVISTITKVRISSNLDDYICVLDKGYNTSIGSV